MDERSGSVVVISGMAVVSAFGIGAEPFTAGVRAGRTAFTAHPEGWVARAGLVPGLDADDDFAATKQVRLKERSSALAVGTVAKLLAGAGLGELPAARRGLVLGSGLASIDTFVDISRDSLAGRRPYYVDHKRVPACAMNYTSSQAAIRFDLRGPNVTVTAGRATGLVALTYGARLLAAGRADVVLCGAFEEVTARRLRVEAATDRLDPDVPPGEGCCVFLLESAASAAERGRPVLAEVLAVRSGHALTPDGCGPALAGTAERVLRRAGVTDGDVRTVVRGTPGDGFAARREAAVVADRWPDARVVDPAALLGDTYGASAAFGLATALVHGTDPGRADGVTLVTSVDPDGQVACAVVRP